MVGYARAHNPTALPGWPACGAVPARPTGWPVQVRRGKVGSTHPRKVAKNANVGVAGTSDSASEIYTRTPSGGRSVRSSCAKHRRVPLAVPPPPCRRRECKSDECHIETCEEHNRFWSTFQNSRNQSEVLKKKRSNHGNITKIRSNIKVSQRENKRTKETSRTQKRELGPLGAPGPPLSLSFKFP